MNDMIFPNNTQGYQCHETIVIIAFVVIKVSANVGYAQWISVSGDARHHAVVYPLCFVVVDVPESE